MPMNDLRLNQALDETFNDLAAYLAQRFTAEIREAKWSWPREPSPRDIVDTGNLAKSLRVSPVITVDNRMEISFVWNASHNGRGYAAAVHDGAVFKRVGRNGEALSMPARPWTRPVLYDRSTIQAYVQRRFALAMKRQGDGEEPDLGEAP
jgi:hypothetical protein